MLIHPLPIVSTSIEKALSFEMPDKGFILQDVSANEQFGFFEVGEAVGLAFFSSQQEATTYALTEDLSGIVAVRSTFGQARDIAKSKGGDVNSLIYLTMNAAPSFTMSAEVCA